MDYRTDYYLTLQDFDSRKILREINSELHAQIFQVIKTETEECFDEFGEMRSRWREWEKDLKRISTIFPTTIFELEGIGDDDEDRWKAIIFNGKCLQKYAQIIQPSITIEELLDDNYSNSEREKSDCTN